MATVIPLSRRRTVGRQGNAPGVPFRRPDTPLKPAEALGEIALAEITRLYGAGDFDSWNPSDLVTARGLEIYDSMRRDDMLKASLAFRKRATVGAGWRINPPASAVRKRGRPAKRGVKQESDQTIFVRWVLEHLEGSFDEVMNAALSCLDYGFSLSELVFEQVTSGPWAGRIGLKRIRAKKPHHFRFRTDEFGNVTAVVHVALPDAPIPPQKFLHMVQGSAFANPYGVSELESAYRPWFVSDAAHKWMAMMLERYGIPPLVVRYNPLSVTPSDRLKIRDAIERIQAGAAAAIPGGKDAVEVTALQMAGQVSQVFIPALEFLDRAKARSLLMPGLLGITPEQIGNSARVKAVFDVFMMTVEFERAKLRDAVIQDQLVKKLVDLNWTREEVERSGGYPTFALDPITEEDMQPILQEWRELMRVGAVKQAPEDEPHIRSLMGFPERERMSEDDTPITSREIFSYHMAGNLVTVDELRAALGLPNLGPPMGNLPTGIAAQFGVNMVDPKTGKVDPAKIEKAQEMEMKDLERRASSPRLGRPLAKKQGRGNAGPLGTSAADVDGDGRVSAADRNAGPGGEPDQGS